jgi:hypothetical protein
MISSSTPSREINDFDDHMVDRKAWKLATNSNAALCNKICRFSNSTYFKLQRLQEDRNFPQLLRESLSKDILSPLFHFGLYEHVLYDLRPAYFVADNFFEGMNFKLDVLVDYIRHCIDKYGFENVILPDTYPAF